VYLSALLSVTTAKKMGLVLLEVTRKTFLKGVRVVRGSRFLPLLDGQIGLLARFARP
jgi:hypothetical protein